MARARRNNKRVVPLSWPADGRACSICGTLGPRSLPHMLGIIGGIAPASTVAYYQGIVARFRALENGPNFPHLIINSINLRTMLAKIEAGDFAGAVSFL